MLRRNEKETIDTLVRFVTVAPRKLSQPLTTSPH
jgi:hypothetical protein